MSRFQIRNDVVTEWQEFWGRLCDMAYLRKGIVEELSILPIGDNQPAFYERNKCSNMSDITLEHTWKKYSSEFSDVQIVPELKNLYVPASLFSCLGVNSWFKYSFPNCKVQFWEE